MLEFSGVTYSYQDAGAPAVCDVSFALDAGQRMVLLGANGSGKSTVALLANGLLVPDEGAVTVDGCRTDEAASRREIRSTVGVVRQDPEAQIVTSSVEAEVAFGPENLGLARDEIAERVAYAIKATGLAGKEHREPSTLSGGEKQRLVIAGMLAMRPRYLVLDEPAAMLDAQGRAEVREAMHTAQALGCGVLLITHDLAECVEADRVLVLSEGEAVFDGLPRELLSNEELIASAGLGGGIMQVLAGELRELGVQLPANPFNPSQLAESVVRHWRRDGSKR